MKAYLFGSIFYDKDIEYNKSLLTLIRRAWPGIDIYAPQEAPFNDKRTCADTKAIFDGDYARLKETDLLIGCLDGDIPPIGSVTEAGIFCAMAQTDPKKHMVVLHTDTREGAKTASPAKYFDLEDNQCHSQMNYFNLFTAGAIENCGVIVSTKEQLAEYVAAMYYDYVQNNHFAGIYMITNRINNKRYIGLSKDIPTRLNQHRWPGTANPQAIDLAIQKYGIENFTFEVLEECAEEELNAKEQYWCDEVFGCTTYAPAGYNIAVAGNAHHGNPGTVVSCYTLDGQRSQTFPSLLAAAHDMRCNARAIRQAVDQNTRTSCGYLWCMGTAPQCAPHAPNSHHGSYKKVDVYDSQGVFLRTYDTITDAAQGHNVNLNRACASYHSPGHLRASGLYFIPHGLEWQPSLHKISKQVHYYDRQHRTYVGTFEDAASAGQALGADASSIGKCAKGQHYYSAGYIWSYMKFEQIPADYKTLNEQYWKEVTTIMSKESECECSPEACNE